MNFEEQSRDVSELREQPMEQLRGPEPGPAADAPRRWKAVYTIVERAGKKFWIRIGTAFINRDESMNVRLDATPTNDQLHIRDVDPVSVAGPRRYFTPAVENAA